MKNYRKIYEDANGPIPTDATGRKMEIHHIDGDHNNNDISNLKLVTIQEHYDIHYNQGDWAACYYMSLRMQLSPSEISEMASKRAIARVLDGTHNFVGNRNPVYNQLANGHHFVGGEIQRKNIEAGVHNFVTNNPGKEVWTCQHCKKTGQGKGNFTRYHGNNCKVNPV